MVYVRYPKPVPGEWKGLEEKSREYEVDLPEGEVEDLRSLLRKAANSFDQEVIRLKVAGYVEYIAASPADGFLK